VLPHHPGFLEHGVQCVVHQHGVHVLEGEGRGRLCPHPQHVCAQGYGHERRRSGHAPQAADRPQRRPCSPPQGCGCANRRVRSLVGCEHGQNDHRAHGRAHALAPALQLLALERQLCHKLERRRRHVARQKASEKQLEHELQRCGIETQRVRRLPQLIPVPAIVNIPHVREGHLRLRQREEPEHVSHCRQRNEGKCP